MNDLPQTSRPIPVLFLVPHLGTGGAPVQLVELVTRMDRARFRPIVVCQKEGGEYLRRIASAGLETHELRLPHRGDPRFALRLAAICTRNGVRAMVIRGFSTMVVGVLVGKVLRIRPILMAEHASGRADRDPKKRPIERRLAPRVDGAIAIAQGQIPFLVQDKGFDPARIRIIYNGLDLAQWMPGPRDTSLLREIGIPENAPVAGILAMLRPEKDHSTFLEAARLVRRKLPEARFVVVGDGPERTKLETLNERLGLAGRVLFTGKRADVARVLTVFDVAALCSTTVETLPVALLESMAMERPIVATRVGGIPEMIDEGANGLLVPPRDPDALAAALVEVLSDKERAQAMGRRSREIVEERFSTERMVRDTETYLASFFPG